ncbi:PREDICTED: secretion-regulating guanine nucleotide exchange factor-like [Polistes dominula]|uniref:Secretion-regulating guanine nucleotide exchange factor-like n=1 Tax=Polistes dominula TaxID=743375 RepID=A0ABM1IDM6_POLDO|nr:PREDICTED: secretion-regulating guanine nucleotide exchange factor-like [Polistes dominula]
MATYHLLSWGANSHGQLGHGMKSEQCILPQEIDLSSYSFKPEDIQKIVGGAGHSLILNKNGHVYSCGWNNKGQLGQPEKEDKLNFERIRGILENEIIVDIACGWDSSAALTNQGKLYMWGSNNFGQLGIDPSTLRHSYEPIETMPCEKIKRVAMGLRHTAVITQDHRIFVCGAAGKGQLGLKDNSNESIDRRNQHNFYPFTLISELKNVADVSCGQHHTVVATDKAEIYVFGANNYGQLGIDNELFSTISSPTKLTTVHFNLAIETYTGWTHTIILTDNKLFAWGRNTYGQLGENRTNPWKADLIKNIPKIHQLSVGSQHNIALTDEKTVLCWGWNEHGNCGTGDINDVLLPRQVSLPSNSEGILVGTGAGHSFAVIRKKKFDSEQEAKFVNDRIASVEKHFSELCAIFAAFIRKAARLRDKNDEVAKTIHTYAESELINRSLKHGLLNFSATLSAIGDYRDAQVQRLDAKVTAPLSQYATICKHARDDVKNTFAARDKELTKRKQLDRIREKNPRNRQMISQAESELMKAAVEVSRVIKGLEEQIDSFERRKLHDLKSILLDFVTIEMSFHTKAIELLTKAYQDIADINETKDLEEFRETMRVPDSITRLDTVRRMSFRQAYSLSNLASRFTSSPKIPQKSPHDRTTELADSLKTGFTNSSESIQVEEYGNSSEETDSESFQEKPPVRTRHKSM